MNIAPEAQAHFDQAWAVFRRSFTAEEWSEAGPLIGEALGQQLRPFFLNATPVQPIHPALVGKFNQKWSEFRQSFDQWEWLKVIVSVDGLIERARHPEG